MLSFHHITKEFKNDFWAKPARVLDDISFKLKEGAITGFLGANGAGKTTSLKIALGFIKPQQGRVEFSNVLGRRRHDIFSHIGYLPERPYFYPHLTGDEFINYIGEIFRLDKVELEGRKKYWGERFNITYAFDRKINNYSKGMLQRLGFVSALINNPKLVILDEPLSGLDPIGRKELKDAIVDLNKKGVTIFFSSHIVSDVEEICHQLIFLDKGRVVYSDSLESVLSAHNEQFFEVSFTMTSPKNEFAQYLVAGSLYKRILKREEKNNFIKSLVESGDEVIKIQPSQLSLEEVLYKVKS